MAYQCADGYHHRMDGLQAKRVEIKQQLEIKFSWMDELIFEAKLTFMQTPLTLGQLWRLALYLK